MVLRWRAVGSWQLAVESIEVLESGFSGEPAATSPEGILPVSSSNPNFKLNSAPDIPVSASFTTPSTTLAGSTPSGSSPFGSAPSDSAPSDSATPGSEAETFVSDAADFTREDTLVVPETTSITGKIKKRNRSSDWQFATSLYYFPEWMFNTLEGDKFVSNFGIEESFRYGRYVLRTGIGLSIAKGTNELMVEYNDYLGSFDLLDSIRFNWDEKNYHLLPTYYTSNKDVWDSLLKLDNPKVIKRYTYLQIPFILGYDVLQTKRISVGFRAGPVLSLLIHSKQLSVEYDPGKNQIIRINQVTPDRVQTNWQLMGGINVSLPIAKRIGFEIEPNIKYYFNSVYEKSDASKKPWSVGFRACFSIRY
ncbi:MAG: hypothetical protein IH596_14645 [Bacteroidales bacterium]|nr:hypothetical protein [Bacteroidales bacterium]